MFQQAAAAVPVARSPAYERMTGRLIMLHGRRFVVLGEDGRPKRFQLSYGAMLEPMDLSRLLHGQRRVAVDYRSTSALWADTAVRLIVQV